MSRPSGNQLAGWRQLKSGPAIAADSPPAAATQRQATVRLENRSCLLLLLLLPLLLAPLIQSK